MQRVSTVISKADWPVTGRHAVHDAGAAFWRGAEKARRCHRRAAKLLGRLCLHTGGVEPPDSPALAGAGLPAIPLAASPPAA